MQEAELLNWAHVASGLGALCLLTLAIILRKVWNNTEPSTEYVDKVIKEVKSEIIKMSAYFEKMCLERQSGCSHAQAVAIDNVCRKLSVHISSSSVQTAEREARYALEWTRLNAKRDKEWDSLYRKREKELELHEKRIAEIWRAIGKHSHEGIEGSGSIIRND